MKASKNSACYDVYVDLTGTNYGSAIFIPSGQIRVVPTNLVFNIPEGFEIQIRSKSGYTSPGVIIQDVSNTLDFEKNSALQITVANLSFFNFLGICSDLI